MQRPVRIILYRVAVQVKLIILVLPVNTTVLRFLIPQYRLGLRSSPNKTLYGNTVIAR